MPRFLDRTEEMRLARRALKGDTVARNKIIENILPFLARLADLAAKRMGGDADDFLSVAVLRVLEKFPKFDPRRARAITYFGFIAKRAIWDQKLRRDRLIYVPTPNQHRGNDCPDRLRAHAMASLDSTMGPGGTLLADTVIDRRAAAVDAEAIRAEQVSLARAAVTLLPDRQRQVMQGRLAGQTLETLSRELNLSRERIRQVESAAQRKLAELMGGP